MSDNPYQQAYSSDSYATRYEPEKGYYPPDDRAFHQPGYFYDSIAAVKNVVLSASGFSAEVVLDSGESGGLRIDAVAAGILRLRMWQGDPVFQETSPMLVPMNEVTPPLMVDDAPELIELQIGQYCLRVGKKPFSLQITNPEGKLIFELDTEKIAGKYTSAPLGFRKKGQDTRWPYLSWMIDGTQRYFGFGEKWNKVEKTSTRATIWSADTGGSNTNILSYKSVPVLYSTGGWGLMLHSSYRSYWDVGTFSYTSGSLLSEEANFDMFFFLAPTLKGLIERYTFLTGRPGVPPRWALGIWMSRCAYPDQEVVQEVVTRMRQEGIPFDVIHLDPSWMKHHYYWTLGVDACDFEWDYDTFPKPAELYAFLREQSVGASMWINPYLPEGTAIYDEAKEKGYLVRSLKGGITRLEFGEPVAPVDLTNPAAREWWKEHIKALLRNGGTVLKCDYGDRVPEDALFFNGKTGREMHNLFLHLYNETAFEATREVRGEGIVWRRAGYIGSQRFPGTWAGDTQVTWRGMRGALHGGLSAGFTGDAFWSHDIGGFVGDQPSPELYIRWAQFGLLSPFSRFHGTTPREPWHYCETAMQVVREYANLRYSLIPYFMALALEANANGSPLLRHLKLEFPDEPGVEFIDDQYMLGPDLLLAPVMEEGARMRHVYFPAGSWMSLYNPVEVFVGAAYHQVDVPLEHMPAFVRAGAVIPRYLQALQHLKGPAAQELALEIYPGSAQRSFDLDEGGQLKVDYQLRDGVGRLRVSPAPITIEVRLIGWNAILMDDADRSMPKESEPNTCLFRLNAAGGIDLRVVRED